MVDFTAYRHPVLAVPCPDCGRRAGVMCRRPSGHKASGFHARRKAEADRRFIAQHGASASIERTARLADRSRRPIAIRPELLNSGAATHRSPKTAAALVPLCAASIGPGRVRTHSLRPVRGDLSSWWRNPAPPSAGLFLGEFPGCLAGTGPIAVPRLIGRGPSHPDHLSPATAPALEKLRTPEDVRVLECHVPIGCQSRDELGTDFHAEVVGWRFGSRQSCIQTLVAMMPDERFRRDHGCPVLPQELHVNADASPELPQHASPHETHEEDQAYPSGDATTARPIGEEAARQLPQPPPIRAAIRSQATAFFLVRVLTGSGAGAGVRGLRPRPIFLASSWRFAA